MRIYKFTYWSDATESTTFHATSFEGAKRYVEEKIEEPLREGLLSLILDALRCGVGAGFLGKGATNRYYVSVSSIDAWVARLSSETPEHPTNDTNREAADLVPRLATDLREKGIAKIANFLKYHYDDPEGRRDLARDLLFPTRESADEWRFEAARQIIGEEELRQAKVSESRLEP